MLEEITLTRLTNLKSKMDDSSLSRICTLNQFNNGISLWLIGSLIRWREVQGKAVQRDIFSQEKKLA